MPAAAYTAAVAVMVRMLITKAASRLTTISRLGNPAIRQVPNQTGKTEYCTAAATPITAEIAGEEWQKERGHDDRDCAVLINSVCQEDRGATGARDVTRSNVVQLP